MSHHPIKGLTLSTLLALAACSSEPPTASTDAGAHDAPASDTPAAPMDVPAAPDDAGAGACATLCSALVPCAGEIVGSRAQCESTCTAVAPPAACFSCVQRLCDASCSAACRECIRGGCFGEPAPDAGDPDDAGPPVDSGAPIDAGPGGCRTNDDCADSDDGRFCNTATGACARCVTRSDCGTGRYCDTAMNRCEYGCGADADCEGTSFFGTPTPRCDTARNTCEPCVTDAHCAAGQVCTGNRCVAGCSASRPCPSGAACCAGACVDTTASAAHCGACGMACSAPAGATASCRAGACGLGACLPGRADCDRSAANGCEVDTATSVTSCGACGTVCPSRPNAAPGCAAGACAFTCGAGFADCDHDPADGCEVDVRSTAAHCGGCGRACLPGQSCSAGACTGTPTCAAPLTGCGTSCVDVRIDRANCGTCGNACPASLACVAGACLPTCATGTVRCGALCVDTRTDAANCGACGHACVAPAGGSASCAAGSCAGACPAGNALEGGACVDIAASLSGLRWELPCRAPRTSVACATSVPTPPATTLSGSSARQYDLVLRFRGVVERQAYAGGAADGPWYVGGSPASNAYNIYSLTTSSPAQTYYVNAGPQAEVCVAIDFVRTVRVNGGARVQLSASTGNDAAQLTNHDAAGQAIVVPGIAPSPSAYDGQFVQMDVVSVTPVP